MRVACAVQGSQGTWATRLPKPLGVRPSNARAEEHLLEQIGAVADESIHAGSSNAPSARARSRSTRAPACRPRAPPAPAVRAAFAAAPRWSAPAALRVPQRVSCRHAERGPSQKPAASLVPAEVATGSREQLDRCGASGGRKGGHTYSIVGFGPLDRGGDGRDPGVGLDVNVDSQLRPRGKDVLEQRHRFNPADLGVFDLVPGQFGHVAARVGRAIKARIVERNGDSIRLFRARPFPRSGSPARPRRRTRSSSSRGHPC